MRQSVLQSGRKTAITFVLILALSASAPAFGAPTNAEIEAKQAEAEAAQAARDTMAAELEVRIEEYNAITEALEQTRAQIKETQADLELASLELEESQLRLAERANNIYRDGGTGMLEVLLGTDSFEDFVSRIDLLSRINRSDAQIVANVKEAKAQVEALERSLETREAEQISLRQDAEQRAKTIEADVEKQEQYIASLSAEVKELIAEEEERQAKLAAERAAALAKSTASNSGSSGRAATDPDSLGVGRSDVVAIAMQYLGVPYVWGGSSPSGFDCSGLSVYVYNQVGVSLPRTSYSQYKVGQHIDADRLDLLAPGDLVFFGTDGDPSRVHHVGIYVGSGNFIHAPQTGDVVKISSLTERIASRGDYVGASRF
ncbi:MAG: C40 family peptidase [Coriobacteriia bacterium]|nr:C40 family peptidase [Coriobacteriia bacterium]MBN2821820.1 C40 family peptidase [Coriobacteriia bacterium]